jgi:hypothetical protein
MSTINLGKIIGEIPLRIDFDYDDIGKARFTVSVKLLADYEMHDPSEGRRIGPPLVQRLGVAQFPHLARKGTIVEVERCEALALVAAGAGEFPIANLADAIALLEWGRDAPIDAVIDGLRAIEKGGAP